MADEAKAAKEDTEMEVAGHKRSVQNPQQCSPFAKANEPAQVKNFLLRRKQNKPKPKPLQKEDQGKNPVESQAADLRRITKSPR